jgi:hypothetical protein
MQYRSWFSFSYLLKGQRRQFGAASGSRLDDSHQQVGDE